MRAKFAADYSETFKNMKSFSTKYTGAFLLIFLGTLSAFGPFVMDMYLPVLPSMTSWFMTSDALVQLGLTTGLVGLAAGQLLFGPISDKYGRRKPLITAMIMFITTTAGCIFASNIWQFIVMRLFQGLAGSGAVVLSRSIATDKYKGDNLTVTMSLISAINGVATVAAPIVGGVIGAFGGWRTIFWSLLALGIVILAGAFRMHESLPARVRLVNARDTEYVSHRTSPFISVLRNRLYVKYVLIYTFSLGVLFTNLASAPFIMQDHFGLSAMDFSIVFGFNAVAFAIASAFLPKFKSRSQAITFGTVGMVVVSCLIMIAFATGCGFWIYEGLIFILLSMVAVTSTAGNVSAMDYGRDVAGAASALLGAVGYGFGGLIPVIVSCGDIFVMTGVMFLLCSAMTALCTQIPEYKMSDKPRTV